MTSTSQQVVINVTASAFRNFRYFSDAAPSKLNFAAKNLTKRAFQQKRHPASTSRTLKQAKSTFASSQRHFREVD